MVGLLPGLAAVACAAIAVTPMSSRGRVLEEPYLAVRTGLRCAQCHVNRTGGGGRSNFGNVYAQTRLAMRNIPFRSRAIGDVVSIGANLRVMASGALSEQTPRTAIDLNEANIQAEVRLADDALAVYVDQTLGPGTATTREAFALVEQLPLDGFVKAGKFLLPYGLRLADDQEFIRQRTGFNYATPDLGVEVGIEPGPLSVAVALTNGTLGAPEANDEKQVTGTAVFIHRRFRIGGSASRNVGTGARRDVVGAFGGLSLGRFTILGEADRIADRSEAGSGLTQLAVYAEGDFLVTRGLNVKVTYGFLDPDTEIGENARIRMRFGVEAFPIPFLQLSTFYTLLDDIPQAVTDVDRIHVELHLYF